MESPTLARQSVSADLSEFGRAERSKWGPLIKAAGIKAE